MFQFLTMKYLNTFPIYRNLKNVTPLSTIHLYSVGDLLSEDNSVQEQFIDLVNDGDAKCSFCEICCGDFWIQMAMSYPDAAMMALKLLIPFPTTCRCKKVFSLVTIKTKS